MTGSLVSIEEVRRLFAACGIAAAFLLSGCAGGSSAPAAATSAPAVQATSAPALTPTPAPSTLEPSTAAPSASTSPAATTARCKDKAGDAEVGDFQQVDLKRSGDELVATFAMTATPPKSGTFSALVNVSDEPGNLSRQLGVKWQDGELVGYFIFDSGTAEQTNLDGEPTIDGKSVAMSFPWSSVEDLGDVWNWYALTTVDGEDVDTCPEPGESVLDLKRSKFPS